MKFVKHRWLLASLAIVALAMCAFVFAGASLGRVLAILAFGQLALIALSGPRPALYMATFTPGQVDNMMGIMTALDSYKDVLKGLPDRLRAEEKRLDALHSEVRLLRKTSVTSRGGSIRTIGGQDFIGDEAAQALTADVILQLQRQPGALETLVRDQATRERLVSAATQCAGFATTKAALDATTTPLPTIYVPQVIELVWKYGQARQFATVYPLGAGTVKLPRLKAGEDDFGYLGAGTAGFSQAVPEKRVTAELITFTANKCGGLIRIPTEIEEDTFIPLGQFLARYIARQLAKLEDKTMFLGDGTATYASVTGVCPYCAAAPGTYLQQLAAGKTKISDATVNDFRVLRSKINPAALVDDAAYYMNPTMEGLLVTFNTIGQPLIYRPQNGVQPATLDGFPIRWVGILPAYSTVASPSAFAAAFGSLRYWFLGERGAPRIEVSREVFFATDEIAMRALERIDVEGMAIDAMSALQTAAA